MNKCILRFNGERLDTDSGNIHLGNGYRAYNPKILRFNAPDTLSPFEAGGVNSYAYCAGDPINHADPSGHLSWQAALGIGMGVVGLAMAVFTAGTSIAAAGSVMAAIESTSAMSLVTGAAGVLSDVAAIASGAAEGDNPKASAALGWVSLGLGIVGMIKGASGLAGRGGRPFGALMTGERQFATGEFRNPVYLGTSTGHFPSFDFLFEDTTSLGFRRLNIITEAEIRCGANPTLPVNLWNESLGVNQVIELSPEPGAVSVLDARLLDANGEQYPVYRFGAGYAAETRGRSGFTWDRYPRNFARLFSHRMQGSRVQVARQDVMFNGDAFEDVLVAAREVYRRSARLDREHGQEILNVISWVWRDQTGVFELRSQLWSGYYNGRL